MNRRIRLGILLSGRGSNMRAIVDACRSGRIDADVALVASNRQRAPGLAWAREAGLPTACVPHRGRTRADFEAALDAALRDRGVQLVALAGFMRILSADFVRRWTLLNIHPALLPAFPGLHAQRQALEAGVAETGCTVHLVDEGVDTGPIVAQARVPVLPGDTEETLSARILEAEHLLYPAAIQLVIRRMVRGEPLAAGVP